MIRTIDAVKKTSETFVTTFCVPQHNISDKPCSNSSNSQYLYKTSIKSKLIHFRQKRGFFSRLKNIGFKFKGRPTRYLVLYGSEALELKDLDLHYIIRLLASARVKLSGVHLSVLP